MPTLYGKTYSISELRQRVGAMSQLAGIRSSTFNDGNATGGRALDVYTGSGLRFTVLPERGLDIAGAEWQGIPLEWHSSTGIPHPAYYEPEGISWLRSFYGGLLVTCGLMNVGNPSTDNGENFGLHGRINNIPAQQVSYDTAWEGDAYILTVKGKVRETRVFGENVLLTRTIRTQLGSNTIHLTDEIANEGFSATPMMLLYHINLGFPVLDETSRLHINSTLTPRNEEAAKGLAVAKEGAAPNVEFKEQVHHHQVTPEKDGWAQASLINPAFNGGQGLGIKVRYHAAELPHFWQWRMVGAGTYVMGLEPANCYLGGRGVEREQGRLPMLEAGEVRTHQVEISVLTTPAELSAASRA